MGWPSRSPGEGPVLELEQLLTVFFSEHSAKDDLQRTHEATADRARHRSAESHVVGAQYLTGSGPFPQRTAQHQLSGRFLTDFCTMVGEWAARAQEIVDEWPADLAELRETVRPAASGAEEPGGGHA